MKLDRWFGATAVAAAVLVFAAARGVAEDTASSGGDKPKFVGDKACQKCHFQEHKAWKKTNMAKAMDSLKPTDEAANKALFDKKKASGVDPAKDYTTDATCLPCHTTGFNAGGYPEKGDTEEAKKLQADFGKVACEACHGAGEKYAAFKTEELGKNKDAKFTSEQLAPLGLVKPDQKLCETCHNDKNPTKGEFKFDDDKAKVHPTKK